ncbi:MAG: HK97 family phage prohead protease [Rhodospirillaceae bacterium]
MTDPIRKTYTCEVKAVDAEAGVYELWASTEDIDRDGDVLIASGAQLENYLKNPVVLYGHNYYGFPVAKTLEAEVVVGKGLRVRFQFAPKGTHADIDAVRSLWEGGFLNAASVGFRPLKWQDRKPGADESFPSWYTPRVYTEWELLEWSIVPVPANQDALRLAAKAMADGLKAKASGDDPWASAVLDTLTRPDLATVDREKLLGNIMAWREKLAGVGKVMPELEADLARMAGTAPSAAEQERRLNAAADGTPIEKRGRVLSAANEKELRTAHEAIGRVLSQLAEQPQEEESDKSAPATEPAEPVDDGRAQDAQDDLDADRLADALFSALNALKGATK